MIGALTSHFYSFANLNHIQISIVLQENDFRFDSPHYCIMTNIVLMMVQDGNNDFSRPLR